MSTTDRQERSHRAWAWAWGWVECVWVKMAHCGDAADTLHYQWKDTACHPSETGGGQMNHILLSSRHSRSPSSVVSVAEMDAMLKDAVRLGRTPRKITPPLHVLFLGLLLGHEFFF